jgi:hypothetical protein
MVILKLAGFRFIHYFLGVIIGICIYYFLRARITDKVIQIKPDFSLDFQWLEQNSQLISLVFYVVIIIISIILSQNIHIKIPMIFFLLIAIGTTLIFINILTVKRNLQGYHILFQIVIIAFFLRSVSHIIFPEGTPCRDGIYHFLIIAGEIINNGHIPLGYTYTYYPVIHIYSSIGALLSAQNIWITAVWLGVVISTLGLLLIFIVGKKFFGFKVALLSATLYAVYPFLISMGSLVQPLTFTTVFVCLLVFLLYSYLYSHQKKWIILILIAFYILIIAHHFSSIQFLFFLIPMVILIKICNSTIFRTFVHGNQSPEGNVTITGLFILSLLIYWIYVSNTFYRGVKIFEFFTDVSVKTGEHATAKAIVTPVFQTNTALLNELGFSILIIFIMIGILLTLEKSKDNFNFFQVSAVIITISLFLYIAFSYLFPALKELLPYRTYAFLGLTGVLLASISLMRLIQVRSAVPFLILIFFGMTFLMISSTQAMGENSPMKFDLKQFIEIRPTDSQVKVSEYIKYYLVENDYLYYYDYTPWKTKRPSSKNDIVQFDKRTINTPISKLKGLIILLEREFEAFSRTEQSEFELKNNIYDSKKVDIFL